jgi:hypothetical protein
VNDHASRRGRDLHQSLHEALRLEQVLEYVGDDHDVDRARRNRKRLRVGANAEDAAVLRDGLEERRCDVERDPSGCLHLGQVAPIARADVDHPQPADVADEVEEDLVPDVSVVLEGLLEVGPRDLLVVREIPEPFVRFVFGQEVDDPLLDRKSGLAAHALDFP